MRPFLYSEELPVPQPPENVAFSDNTSDSDEDHGRQEGGNVHCDPTFEAICSTSEPHLLTQGDLNDLVREFNLYKKQAELRFQTKRTQSSTQIVKYVSFVITKMK